jgi:hypothetical protein
MSDGFTKLGDALEPHAAKMCEAEPEVETVEVAAISIAISLKRIADRMDDLASGEATIRVQNNY